MPATAKSLVEAANAAVPKISGQEAQDMVAKGAVLVDLRDSAELAATGKAAGSVHIPRGSLEFKADLSSPTAEKSLAHDKPVILHCASGGRAALAGKLSRRWATRRCSTSAASRTGSRPAARWRSRMPRRHVSRRHTQRAASSGVGSRPFGVS
jgi:rhodanese-related sulfurtransferase